MDESLESCLVQPGPQNYGLRESCQWLPEDSLGSFLESLESFLVQPGPQNYQSAWLEPRLPLTQAWSLRTPRTGGLRNEVRGSLGTLGVLHSAWRSYSS